MLREFPALASRVSNDKWLRTGMRKGLEDARSRKNGIRLPSEV